MQCPRCGAVLYADMSVCYGCLYDFTRASGDNGPSELLPGPGPDGAGATVEADAGAAPDAGCEDETPGAGAPRDADATWAMRVPRRSAPVVRREPGMLVETASCDVWVPLGEDVVAVGRAEDNGIVLHDPTVSRHHLRAMATPDGVEVHDCGATNPATYQGRQVCGCVVVSYGDRIQVGSAGLTMTGPVPCDPDPEA